MAGAFVAVFANKVACRLEWPSRGATAASLDHKLAFLRRQLRRRVHLGGDAPKWAWVEYRLARGGFAEGLAAAQAARAGGGFAAWKRALGG